MDPMEIMMKITGFPRLGLKIKQEKTLYSSLLGYSRETSSPISPTDLADSQLTVLHSSLVSTLTRPSILLILSCVTYLSLSHCTKTNPGTLAACFYLIRINVIL